MADLTALQTELETLGRLAAGLEQDRVAVGVTVELLHGRLLDGRAAAGAGVAAGGAEHVKEGGAGLQQTQEQSGAPAPQAGQQQPEAGVCGVTAQNSDLTTDILKVVKKLLCLLKACQTKAYQKAGLAARLTLN